MHSATSQWKQKRVEGSRFCSADREGSSNERTLGVRPKARLQPSMIQHSNRHKIASKLNPGPIPGPSAALANTPPGGVRRRSHDHTRCNYQHRSTRSRPRARRTPGDSLSHTPWVEDQCTGRARTQGGEPRKRFSNRRQVRLRRRSKCSKRWKWKFARARLDAVVAQWAECSGRERSAPFRPRDLLLPAVPPGMSSGTC